MPRTGTRWVLIVGLMLAPACAHAAYVAPKTYERGPDGQWRVLDEPAARADAVANPELDEVEQLLAAGRHGQARPRVVRWVKANPDAPDRDRGLFLLAEMYYQAGDRVRAYYHLDELMDTYPGSRLFYPALEKQYAIADAYLSGYKRRFLGLPLLSARDEAVEMLFRIQERAPGSPIAERSLLRTADYYYEASQFDLAVDAYAAYTRSYPRSPEVPRVRLRQAFGSLAQFRGLRFDATPVVDAKAQLEDIRAEYPQLAEQENVADVLERIDSTLAARVMQTAAFYRRTGEPSAAVYNWRYVVENYPETREAELAQAQIARMPEAAQELPGPRGGDEAPLDTPTPGAAPDNPATPGIDTPTNLD